MRMSRSCLTAGLLAVLFFVPAISPVAGAAKDEVKVVNYTQLGDLIKKNKGKVIVVDFWNIY
jgi:hypothetical protein